MLLKSKQATKKEKHNIRRLSVENFFIDITKNLVSIFYDPGSESFPIPLKYVDEMRLWTYYQGFMHRSEGVTLSGEWTGTARFKILRSWIPAGYTWVTGKTNENLDDYQTRQHMAWNLGNILQESQGNISCMMGRIKCHSASSTLSTEESTRYWPTAKITPKPLLVLVSNSKKILLLLCRALRRMEASQAVATSIGASEEQSDSEICRSMRESEATVCGPHRQKKVCGKLSLWLGTQANICSRSFENTRSESNSG